MDYTNILNGYYTSEGIPFYFLSKSITFPTDDDLEIYKKLYCADDLPWTIVSYKIYGTIDYWWVLSALNKESTFYARAGEDVKIIKPEYIQEVLKYVK